MNPVQEIAALRSVVRRHEADWWLDESDGVWFRFSSNGRAETEEATEDEREAFQQAIEESK